MIGALGAKYLPGFGFNTIQPKRIQPVYIPVWFVDAQFTANVRLAGKPQVEVDFVSENSYMPGFSYAPLSTLSFTQPSMISLAVPFSEDLKTQHGLDVMCIPYTISPLSLPEAANSLFRSRAKIGDIATFEPDSLSFKLLSAYPVLIPVYLAQYEIPFGRQGPVQLTTIMQAHSQDGLTYVDVASLSRWGQESRPHEPSNSLFNKTSRYLGTLGFVPMNGIPDGFSHIKAFPSLMSDGMDNDSDALGTAATDWLDESVSDLDALSKFGVDMNDLRVREYEEMELRSNRSWVMINLTLKKEQALQELSTRYSASGDRAGSSSLRIFDALHGDPAQRPARIETLEELQRTAKPKWL